MMLMMAFAIINGKIQIKLKLLHLKLNFIVLLSKLQKNYQNVVNISKRNETTCETTCLIVLDFAENCFFVFRTLCRVSIEITPICFFRRSSQLQPSLKNCFSLTKTIPHDNHCFISTSTTTVKIHKFSTNDTQLRYQSSLTEADLGLLQRLRWSTLLPAVNDYHKELHLGCCSSPRSATSHNAEKFVSMEYLEPSRYVAVLYDKTGVLA